MDRTKFLKHALQFGSAAMALPLFAHERTSGRNELMEDHEPRSIASKAGLFTQAPLPYAYDALEPHIDARTMELHYAKHHAKYVQQVSDAMEEENITPTTVEEFFASVSNYSVKARNNGGGAWNHELYWRVMSPNGGGEPSGVLREAINGSFGDFATFKAKFTEVGMKRFGSGWAWLVKDGGKLLIGSTPDQDNPMMNTSELRGVPLLGLDVWEHAYYLKHQNNRDEYITNFFKVINWEEVSRLLT